LDLTGASTTVGDSWNIIDHATLAMENYGGTLAVNSTLGSFTNSSGNWSIVENGVTYQFSQSTGVLSVVPTGGYSNWATTNAGGQTAELDFDSDGVDNGIEYFMNSAAGFTVNPNIVGGVITWPNGGNIPASAYGTEFKMQTSSDLATWSDVSVGSLTTNTSGPGGSLTYTLPTGSGKLFVRLVVMPN
jgi:hypothetical protein